MTAEAIVLLIAGLIVFWTSVAALVRYHGRRAASRASHRAGESRG